MSVNEEIKITEDGGVIKKILQVGEGEETPANGSTIQVTYIGTLVDGGKQFDATTDKENPFEFQVGVGQVIKGWDLGMVTMKKGERALFTLSSEYAYGASGSPPTIPPNAALNFEVEMLSWTRNKGDYPEAERFEKAAGCKLAGNDFFKKGEFSAALEQYNEGEEWLETMYDNEQAVQDQLLIRNNMAMVYLKVNDYTKAIQYASKVLEKDPQNQKALFRRGQAYHKANELNLAKQDLKTAYELDQKNAAVIKELQLVQTQIKQQKQEEKKKFQALFNKDLYDDKEDVKISETIDNPSNPSNPRVFMDIKIGSAEPERIEFELYKNVVPKTAENFLELCKTHYKNAIFHRNIKNFMIQGGDYENRNGTGGKSIYGDKFEDENFNVHHTKRGQLSMANAGPNTNGSQFFVLYTNTPHLDGKHVVFGEVSKNIEFLDKLEAAETGAQDKPVEDIVIVDSGVLE